MWTRTSYLQNEAGVSKHSWKKIMQLLWTVVTYLIKNVKHRIEQDIDSTYEDIRHFWQLQQIWWITSNLTLFRMGFSGAAHGWGEGKKASFPKICHTYPAMMKLGTVIPYPRKIQKIFESRDTPLEFCWHQHFFTENQQILLYQEIQI